MYNGADTPEAEHRPEDYIQLKGPNEMRMNSAIIDQALAEMATNPDQAQDETRAAMNNGEQIPPYPGQTPPDPDMSALDRQPLFPYPTAAPNVSATDQQPIFPYPTAAAQGQPVPNQPPAAPDMFAPNQPPPAPDMLMPDRQPVVPYQTATAPDLVPEVQAELLSTQPQAMPEGNSDDDNEDQKKEYRTRNKAGTTTPTVNSLAVITDPKYRHALTGVKDKTAYLLPVSRAFANAFAASLAKSMADPRIPNTTGGLNLSDDQFCFASSNPELIASFDFPMLGAIYSVILNTIQTQIENARDPDEIMRVLADTYDNPNVIEMRLTDFRTMIGATTHLNEKQSDEAVKKLQTFNQVIGIHIVHSGKKTYINSYAVMLWHKTDTQTGKISFSSPYLNLIARTTLKNSLKLIDCTPSRPRMTAAGRPVMRASHSHALSTSLTSERNQGAVEIVYYLTFLIESSGPKAWPSATARTILNECPALKWNIEHTKTTGEQNRKLRRAFSRAWEIMQDPAYTSIHQTRDDLKAQTETPTMKNLDQLTFYLRKDDPAEKRALERKEAEAKKKAEKRNKIIESRRAKALERAQAQANDQD